MKEFIYLDTDYLTSALSQINKGKILSFVSESSDVSQEGTTSASENSNNGNFGLNYIVKVGADNTKSSKDENSMMDISSFKEVITKSFDDYAYDILYNHISENNLLCNGDMYAPYILKQGTFKLIDLDFLDTMLEDDFIDMYIAEDLKMIDQATNREMRRQNDINAIKKEKRNDYKDIKKKLRAFKRIMPGDMILTMDKMIAPIKNRFLRGEYNDISFKYEKINILAKITRIKEYHNYDDTGSELLLSAADYMLPEFLRIFNIKIETGTLVVTPIAIYIE